MLAASASSSFADEFIIQGDRSIDKESKKEYLEGHKRYIKLFVFIWTWFLAASYIRMMFYQQRAVREESYVMGHF